MTDTITAIVTPPGMGGVGIVRLSGDASFEIAKKILHTTLKHREVHVGSFWDAQGEVLDHGCALFFKGPHSFTGEDVVEFQGHGGVAVMQSLLALTIQHGARQAEAGEFTKRAYLNGKIDLAQAEAVADVIHAATTQAAKAAMQSLQGKFSERVHAIADQVKQIRVYIESAMDFSDEAIDWLADETLKNNLQLCLADMQQLHQRVKQGMLSQQGFSVVLAGLPNAGKSSIYNQLAGEDRAIVTAIPGTTRDTLLQTVSWHGLPVTISDTAGLRESDDVVEQAGVDRTKQACAMADCVVWVTDLFANEWPAMDLIRDYVGNVSVPVIVVGNKMDLITQTIDPPVGYAPHVLCSGLRGDGMDDLIQLICQTMGALPDASDNAFSARARHGQALEKAMALCQQAMHECIDAPECAAESLRLCHHTLGSMTGVVTADELLGDIFSTFCIGK